MAQPPRYDRTKDFTADYADETDHAALNAELDGAAQSINAIRDNLALLQRDDGALKNGVVTSDSLAPALKDELISEVAIGIDDKVQQAQAAANDAVNASINASASATNSQTYAEQSLASAGSAQANAQSAGASKTAAALSETNAAASAASALASKNAAATSEANAAASEDAAALSEASAVVSAQESLVGAVRAENAADAATEPVAAMVAQYLDNFIPTGVLVLFSTIYTLGGFDLGALTAASPFTNEDATLRRASMSAGAGVFDYGALP